MGNPSTIWSQLSLPNPPIGSIPFVDIDSTSIVTDVLNFFYQSSTATVPANTSVLPNQLTVLNGIRRGYSDTTTVPGAAVINKTAGRVKFAAGATTLVVQSNCAFATSIIRAQIEGVEDVTATRVRVTAQANGSFTLSLNAACTAAVVVSFLIDNVY